MGAVTQLQTRMYGSIICRIFIFVLTAINWTKYTTKRNEQNFATYSSKTNTRNNHLFHYHKKIIFRHQTWPFTKCQSTRPSLLWRTYTIYTISKSGIKNVILSVYILISFQFIRTQKSNETNVVISERLISFRCSVQLITSIRTTMTTTFMNFRFATIQITKHKTSKKMKVKMEKLYCECAL